ncbi:MAG: flagellar protein FlaG [Chloroflexi bacterium]|nr:flagellar protein FlaG [Chloroflexota bacterium]
MTTISSVTAVTSRASPKTAPLPPAPEQKPAQTEQRQTEAAKQQPQDTTTTVAKQQPQDTTTTAAKQQLQDTTTTVANRAANTVSANVLRDVTLRYQMDPDTQKMMLLIIDRKSREVIRTLPPEELLKMGVDRIFEGLA